MNDDNKKYPTKPTTIEDKSQNEIIAERRAKREQMISGVVGSRREPLRLKYPEPDEKRYALDMHDWHSKGYDRGYENGLEKGKMIGESDGVWKGLLAGVVVSIIVFVWISLLIK